MFTFVGSFVNTGNRGGHTYPDIVLQSEKKPIRVFLQDGRNDNRQPSRRERSEQQRLVLSEREIGRGADEEECDVNYTWGIGNHGQKQGGAIFPEIMRALARCAKVSTDRNTVERSFRAAAPASQGASVGQLSCLP